MHYELCIMNYLLSLHQSCGWQSVALPMGDIFVKAFSALSNQRKSPVFNLYRISGHKTPVRAYTHPIGGVLYIGIAWGGLFIIEMGVWRCLFDYKLSDVPRFRVFIAQ